MLKNLPSTLARNPLLDLSGFTRFDLITTADIDPALDYLLTQVQQTIDHIAAQQSSAYSEVVYALHGATEPLARVWNVIGHLNSVRDDEPWRTCYQNNLPRISAFWTELGQNPALYQHYRNIGNSTEFNTLNAAQQQVIRHALRDFEHSGAALAPAQQNELKQIFQELAIKTNQFSENLTHATDAFHLDFDNLEPLTGLPQSALDQAASEAQQAGVSGYRLTLHAPSYIPVLQYAHKRQLREQIYRAANTRASELGAPEFDNSALIHQILQLRQQAAKLLSFEHYAALSLDSKMAQSALQVNEFLRDLAQRARPAAQKERAELETFAQSHCGISKIEAWDTSFVAEKMRAQSFAYSEEEVRAYFPEHKVWEGLFDLAQRMFGVKIRPLSGDEAVPVWHSTVRFFEVSQNHKVLGHFYLDPYARAGKRGGAWMDDARGRYIHHSDAQTPIAYLVCNFAPPVNQQTSYLTHDEVMTLFHEFGHGLHHLLTQVNEAAVSGINGVEWDGVELPSQFMENFCWDWAVISKMTAHQSDGHAMPRNLFDKLLSAKNFLSASGLLRQVNFSLFDMRVHSESVLDVMDLWRAVEQEILIVPTPAFTRTPNGFAHIFAGGYAAGYYSYKWAEVLSADVYAAFEEACDHNQNSLFEIIGAVGQRYLKEILSQGGARSIRDSFIAFRGRAPSIDALLRHNGLSA